MQDRVRPLHEVLPAKIERRVGRPGRRRNPPLHEEVADYAALVLRAFLSFATGNGDSPKSASSPSLPTTRPDCSFHEVRRTFGSNSRHARWLRSRKSDTLPQHRTGQELPLRSGQEGAP